MEVNTVSQLMFILGKALSEADGDVIMNLQDVNNSWIQTDDEFRAIDTLLTGALDAIGW